MSTSENLQPPSDDQGEQSNKKICATDGCEEKAYARGYCRKCYNKWHRENNQRSADEEELRSLLREAGRAKKLYKIQCGLAARTKRRRDYDEVLTKIATVKLRMKARRQAIRRRKLLGKELDSNNKKQ